MVLFMRKLYSKCLFFDRYHNVSIIIISVVLIILFFLFLLFSLFFKINFSTSYSGYIVKEDDYYVCLFLDDNGIQFLQKNELVVDGDVVDYNIVRISDEYGSNMNRAVILDFDLSRYDKIVNNVIELHFLEKSTIFNKVKELFL